METEVTQIAPPIVPPGQKLEETERQQMEIFLLRVANAQQRYDLAAAALEAADRNRRDQNNEFIAFRTKLETKYQSNLGPDRLNLLDGTIKRPAPSRAPMTPRDFPTAMAAKAELAKNEVIPTEEQLADAASS